jgi:hypothetical protein
VDFHAESRANITRRAKTVKTDTSGEYIKYTARQQGADNA